MAKILFQKTLPYQMALRQIVAYQNPMAEGILCDNWPISAPVFDAFKNISVRGNFNG
jgi:hypothetical protein